MSLSQEFVDSLRYEGSSRVGKDGRKRWREHVVWDDQLPGLGLRVAHTNRKTFVVSYRVDGRRRRKTLGTTDELTLNEARRHASELLESVGVLPPPAPAETAPVLSTVSELAEAWIDHLKTQSPSCFAEQRLIRKHLTAAMGRARLTEVKPTEIDGLKRRVARQFPADGPKLASVLKEMFEWAEEQSLWAPGRTARIALAEAARPAGESRPAATGAEAPPTQPGEPAAASTPEAADESQDLTARLDELSAAGVKMMTELSEQTADRRRLEDELAEARSELAGARSRLRKTEQAAGELQKSEQAVANLGASVEQLLEALETSREENRELVTRLEDAERDRAELESRLAAGSAELEDRLAAVAAERDELANRLLETENAARATVAGGGPSLFRSAGWAAAGALLGALIVLLLPLGPPGPGGSSGESPVGAPTQTSARPPLEMAQQDGPAALSAGRESVLPVEETSPPALDEPTGDEPASTTAVPPTAVGPDPTAVERAVRAWGAAWSEQRVAAYLASYADTFEPPEGLTRAEWESQRHARIRAPASIRLEIGPLEQTRLEPGRVRVAFDQSYATETYSDRVRKILELIWVDGEWKIAVEATD